MKKTFAVGYYHIAAWAIVWATMNLVNAAGANIYRNAICDFYGVSAAPLLDAATLGGWLGAPLFLVLPKVIGRFGAKRVMLFSYMMGGVVFALIPQTPYIIVMQIGTILTGVFAGIYGITTPMIMVSKWFPRTKGQVMGIVSSGIIISTVIMIPVLNALIKAMDVRAAMAIIGAFLIVFGIVNLFILKDTPEEYGLYPDNKEMTDEERRALGAKSVATISQREVLRMPRFWTISLGWGIMLLALIGFTFIAVSYMLERGVPEETAMKAVSVGGILSCGGSIVLGWVDQRIGPVKTAAIASALMMGGMLIVIFYHGASQPIIIAGYLMILTCTGAMNSLGSSHNLSVFGVNDYSVSFNLQTAIGSVIKMFGTFVAARSITWVGDYSIAYKVYGVSILVGAILIILTGEKRYDDNKKEL